ncbi:piggyBac transposable element-derived 4-like protein [Labeo rohita]|nr:piggyBac transposable element-derived 4-like protein [Labeo rohita]
MAHEEALQTTMDSEEECDFSSEGGEDFDDDLFHLEEAAEETISKEKEHSSAHHTRVAHKRLSVFNAVENLKE